MAPNHKSVNIVLRTKHEFSSTRHRHIVMNLILHGTSTLFESLQCQSLVAEELAEPNSKLWFKTSLCFVNLLYKSSSLQKHNVWTGLHVNNCLKRNVLTVGDLTEERLVDGNKWRPWGKSVSLVRPNSKLLETRPDLTQGGNWIRQPRSWASGKIENWHPASGIRNRNGNRNRDRDRSRNMNRNGKRKLYKNRDNVYRNLSQSGFNPYSDIYEK